MLYHIRIIEITTIYLFNDNIVIIIKNIRRVKVKIGILLLALLPMLIISGVDGIGFSMLGGKEGHACKSGSQIEAGDGVDVSGHFSLQGDNLAGNCNFKGEGRLKVSETKTDKAEDSITLSAEGILQSGDYYKPCWTGGDTFISGTQGLKATGRSIECSSEAVNRNGLAARVSAGVDKGSIDIKQGATASDSIADAWQGINSAMGENIELNAETSDRLEQNKADSSVKINCGALLNYNSDAQALEKTGYVDFSAIHGAFNLVDNKVNPRGSISGDIIRSKGSATSETGSKANYEVTIKGRDKKPAVEGRFDWGTETTSEGYVIAAPLESPLVWWGGYGIPGEIEVSASKISSCSEALDGQGNVVESYTGSAKKVNIKGWSPGLGGVAKSSETGISPSP